MTEISSKSPHHRSHPHSHTSSTRRNRLKKYLNLVFSITISLLMCLVALIFDAGIIPILLGACAIITLVISGFFKFKSGVIISIGLLILMTMSFTLKWVDSYLFDTFSASIASDKLLFYRGLLEGSILIIMVWLFYKQFDSLHLQMNKKWFEKKTYTRIFNLLFSYILFLTVFWIFSFIGHKVTPLTHLSKHKTILLAAGFSLFISGILLIIISAKPSHHSKKSHRHHHHHHHHHSENSGKNLETDQ